MPKATINPPQLFNSLQYGFSQVVTHTGGKQVYLSGQVGWDAGQQMTGPGDLRAQTWQTLRNIETAMQAAGGVLSDVVAMRIYIVQYRHEMSPIIQEALKAFFPPEHAPATTWINVAGLANPEFLIEIEATAVIEA